MNGAWFFQLRRYCFDQPLQEDFLAVPTQASLTAVVSPTAQGDWLLVKDGGME